jgi:hypothetical protein
MMWIVDGRFSGCPPEYTRSPPSLIIGKKARSNQPRTRIRDIKNVECRI